MTNISPVGVQQPSSVHNSSSSSSNRSTLARIQPPEQQPSSRVPETFLGRLMNNTAALFGKEFTKESMGNVGMRAMQGAYIGGTAGLLIGAASGGVSAPVAMTAGTLVGAAAGATYGLIEDIREAGLDQFKDKIKTGITNFFQSMREKPVETILSTAKVLIPLAGVVAVAAVAPALFLGVGATLAAIATLSSMPGPRVGQEQERDAGNPIIVPEETSSQSANDEESVHIKSKKKGNNVSDSSDKHNIVDATPGKIQEDSASESGWSDNSSLASSIKSQLESSGPDDKVLITEQVKKQQINQEVKKLIGDVKTTLNQLKNTEIGEEIIDMKVILKKEFNELLEKMKEVIDKNEFEQLLQKGIDNSSKVEI